MMDSAKSIKPQQQKEGEMLMKIIKNTPTNAIDARTKIPNTPYVTPHGEKATFRNLPPHDMPKGQEYYVCVVDKSSPHNQNPPGNDALSKNIMSSGSEDNVQYSWHYYPEIVSGTRRLTITVCAVKAPLNDKLEPSVIKMEALIRVGHEIEQGNIWSMIQHNVGSLDKHAMGTLFLGGINFFSNNRTPISAKSRNS